MMRVCECGGTIRQHPLTRNREAWTCNACGRYEVIQRGLLAEDAQSQIVDAIPLDDEVMDVAKAYIHAFERGEITNQKSNDADSTGLIANLAYAAIAKATGQDDGIRA